MTDAAIKGRSTAEKVAAELREEIATGAFKPGELLPAEHQLVERFGVSRPTCREAIRILQSEGLLLPLRGNRGGARVSLPDPRRISSYAGVYLQMQQATIQEIFEARRLVEPEAAGRVAEGGDTSLFSAMAQNVAAQQFLVQDRVAFYEKGREFRELMLDGCGSEPIRLFGLMLGHIADRQLSRVAHELPYWERQEEYYRAAIAIKEALLRAMVAGNGAKARALWDDYLTHYINMMTQVAPNWVQSPGEPAAR